MSKLHLPHISPSGAWASLTHAHISVLKLLFLYAVPLSVLPPVMLNYAGVTGGVTLLPALGPAQLQMVGVVFFLAELAMTFLVAYIVQALTEWVVRKPAFEDAYKLAVVVPTPLWLSSLFLVIPSFMLLVTAVAAALILSATLIYYAVPAILKIEDKTQASMLFGLILAIGMVAWALMLYLTLLTWSYLIPVIAPL
jgi:Yip1 domain